MQVKCRNIEIRARLDDKRNVLVTNDLHLITTESKALVYGGKNQFKDCLNKLEI